MILETKKIGRIEVDEKSIIEFPKGLIGFENCRRFALIKNEDFDPFCWLISLDGEELSFPLLNPNLVNPEFDSVLSQNIIDYEFSERKTENIFCVVNVNGVQGKFTINLKSPIFVDLKEKKGKQFILDSDELLIDQPVW